MITFDSMEHFSQNTNESLSVWVSVAYLNVQDTVM